MAIVSVTRKFRELYSIWIFYLSRNKLVTNWTWWGVQLSVVTACLQSRPPGKGGRFPRPRPYRADLGAPLAGRGVPVLRFQPSRGRESVDSVGRMGQGPEEFSVASSLVQTSDLRAPPCSGPGYTKLPSWGTGLPGCSGPLGALSELGLLSWQ